MASSKVVTTNTDLPRESSSSSSSSSHHHLLAHSNSMDDLLNSIYTPRPSSSPSPPHPPKAVDDVWKDMILTQTHAHSHRASGEEEALEEMTLEAFLTKAGAVREEDVAAVTGLVAPPPPSHQQRLPPQFPVAVEGGSSSSVVVVEPSFANNGIDGGGATVIGVPASSTTIGGGKGKKRVVEEPADKATLQKQRRMIKNRESAARSRERKQAYTTELEYLVQQLEMENARLLSEEADKRKQRLKELNEFIIPVAERRKPKRLLRTSSVQSL